MRLIRSYINFGDAHYPFDSIPGGLLSTRKGFFLNPISVSVGFNDNDNDNLFESLHGNVYEAP